jgi:glycosyltransferase involved in cell wall biosynthesis
MTSPKLSIILPNYNHAKFLPRCLDSSLQQSFTDLELIAVDDCSTDDSYTILQEYARRDSRIRLYRNEKNLGVVATLNRALSLARGDYVHGAASDDYILPGYYEAAMTMFAQHPQAAIVLGMTRCEYDNSPKFVIVPGDWADERTYLAPDEMAERIAGCGIPGPTIWKREPFLAVGGYIPELCWHCDWFTLQIIAFRHGVCFLPEVFTVVRNAEDSYSNTRNRASGVQKTVLQALLSRLQRPEYRDVLPQFERSGVLRQFEFDLVEAAIAFEGSLAPLMGMLKPHVLPHTANLLHSQSAAQRAGMARFLGQCGIDGLSFDKLLAEATRDSYPKVATAAAEARAAIRRSVPTVSRLKRQLRQTIGRILRRVDRFVRPRIHDHLERQEVLLTTISMHHIEMRSELLGQLKALREELDAMKRERATAARKAA